MIKFSLFLTLIIQYSLSYGAQSHSDVVYGEDNREEISLYHGQLWSDVSKSIALQVNKENINIRINKSAKLHLVKYQHLDQYQGDKHDYIFNRPPDHPLLLFQVH